LGAALLPLVDPYQGAPLLETLNRLRNDLSRELGLVTPGIRVRDDFRLGPHAYLIKIRETPLAWGELFLDRFLIAGDGDKLDQYKGWSTREPVYGIKASWVEPSDREKAEKDELLVLGPMNVLITHLKDVILTHAHILLGLQDLHNLLEKLAVTHPIVIEPFMANRNRLRLLRRVLHNLLRERVSIRDMVTILEILDEHLDELERTDLVGEYVRLGLARQIIREYLDAEAGLQVLLLSPELEKALLAAFETGPDGRAGLKIDPELADELVRSLKHQLEETPVPALLVVPPLRPYLRRMLENVFPGLGVLSKAELYPGLKFNARGEVAPAIGEAEGEGRESSLLKRWRKRD